MVRKRLIFVKRCQYGDFKIEGRDYFITVTIKALKFIKNNSKEHYDLVKNHIKGFEEVDTHKESGVYTSSGDKTFYVSGNSCYNGLKWYAGSMVHDAYHLKLYNDYYKKHGPVPKHIYSGEQAEMECLAIQKEFLTLVNARERDMNAIEEAPATR